MNWDQIESKWAAMAGRVRADWLSDRTDATSRTVRRAAAPDVKRGVPAGGPVAGDARQKMSDE